MEDPTQKLAPKLEPSPRATPAVAAGTRQGALIVRIAHLTSRMSLATTILVSTGLLTLLSVCFCYLVYEFFRPEFLADPLPLLLPLLTPITVTPPLATLFFFATRSLLDMADRIQAQQLKLEQLVAEDHLTGLYNRRHFLELTGRELRLVRRFGTTSSLLFIDVDHFKCINDSHGHLIGDAALRHVAQLIRSSVREVDIVCRFGGEEFLVLLAGASESDAFVVAERMRTRLQAAAINLEQATVSITVSIGIASIRATDVQIDAAIQRADAALYEAKHAGRNQTMLAPPPSSSAPSAVPSAR